MHSNLAAERQLRLLLDGQPQRCGESVFDIPLAYFPMSNYLLAYAVAIV